MSKLQHCQKEKKTASAGLLNIYSIISTIASTQFSQGLIMNEEGEVVGDMKQRNTKQVGVTVVDITIVIFIIVLKITIITINRLYSLKNYICNVWQTTKYFTLTISLFSLLKRPKGETNVRIHYFLDYPINFE